MHQPSRCQSATTPRWLAASSMRARVPPNSGWSGQRAPRGESGAPHHAFVVSLFIFLSCPPPRPPPPCFLYLSGPKPGAVGNVPAKRGVADLAPRACPGGWGGGGPPTQVRRGCAASSNPHARPSLLWVAVPLILAVPAGGVCGRRGELWAGSVQPKCARARLRGPTGRRGTPPPPPAPICAPAATACALQLQSARAICRGARPPPPTTPFRRLLRFGARARARAPALPRPHPTLLRAAPPTVVSPLAAPPKTTSLRFTNPRAHFHAGRFALWSSATKPRNPPQLHHPHRFGRDFGAGAPARAAPGARAAAECAGAGAHDRRRGEH